MRVGFVVVIGVMSGCLQRLATPPTGGFVTVGGLTASYRDWARVTDLCLADPALVTGDLESMNALLSNVLDRTAEPPETWTEANVSLLTEAGRGLQVPLALHTRAVQHASKASCQFAGLARSAQLAQAMTRRLADAPALVDAFKARQALVAWKHEAPLRLQADKARVCPHTKAPGPVVFGAFEDERGKTEWHFCDGAKVTATPGSLPTYEAAAAEPVKKPAKGKPVDPKAYLDAQSKFPSAQVNRAPKLGPKRLASRVDAAEPD